MSKIMCDGCREMFTIAELKVHLAIDVETERAGPAVMNNRGNRLSTAPVFNINDPKLTIERCPRRKERVGRAGPMQADLAAPHSLPIVLPYHVGRAQLEELKDTLLSSWTSYQTKTAKQAALKEITAHAKDSVPSASSALRPREGRNMLLGDDVKKMNLDVKRAAQASASAVTAAPPAVTSSVPAPMARQSRNVPSYMQPLSRSRVVATPPASQGPPTVRGIGQPAAGAHCYADPQAVSGACPGKGSAGYVRISAGNTVPYYVKFVGSPKGKTMQTSFTSSHEQSTDSIGSSSIQRSGLAMTVGDTKSIVLALQALQEKIRKLEQDRNFHQEQCEKAQKSHEVYKLEIETQLDSERAQHRSREQELQDLLARANAERSRLQATLEESKSDLGHFRHELEQLLQAERQQARTREDQLMADLEQIRSDLAEEHRQAEALSESLEKLKAEKEIISTTNRRLESTVRDLISVNNNLMDSVKRGSTAVLNSGAKQSTSRNNASRIVSHADPNANVSTASARRGHSRDVAPSARRVSNNTNVSSSRFTYMNPTHASAIRDVRNGEVARSSTPQRPPSPRPAPRSSSRPRSLNTSAVIQPEQVRAMDEVHEELQQELRELELKYKQSIQDAARSDTSPEVLNQMLNGLMGQIQRKSEQIRLMRQTKHDLAAAAANDTDGERPSRHHTSVKGVDKALQRNQIVSELRSLFTKPSY